MKIIIANAFSLSMLDRSVQRGTPRGYTPHADDQHFAARVPRPCDRPRVLLFTPGVTVESAVGHPDTAVLFTHLLDYPVVCNRATVKLGHGDLLLVGQYIGPRLPEGTTVLPEGATVEWWTV